MESQINKPANGEKRTGAKRAEAWLSGKSRARPAEATYERRKTIVEDSGRGEHRPNEPRNHRSAGERRPIPPQAQNGRVRPLATGRYHRVDTNTLSGWPRSREDGQRVRLFSCSLEP